MKSGQSNAVIKTFSAPPEVMEMLTVLARRYGKPRSQVLALLIRREYIRSRAEERMKADGAENV